MTDTTEMTTVLRQLYSAWIDAISTISEGNDTGPIEMTATEKTLNDHCRALLNLPAWED